MKIDVGLLKKFDSHLADKQIEYSASIIGGTAILLIANSSRVTGDVDSLTQIPEEIKNEIADFAKKQGISANWFNDNASRNFSEFVIKGEDLFSKEVFKGRALKLYAPSIHTLLLSKIYPMLDRAALGYDLEDIETLIVAGFVTESDMKLALEAFKTRIRFEDEHEQRKMSWDLVKVLDSFIASSFIHEK